MHRLVFAFAYEYSEGVLLMFDLQEILPTIGYLGILAVVFAESGLLIGFFLPGDGLLFTAGFLASQGIFDIRTLCLISFIGAVTGDSVGYTFGHRVRKKLLQRENSLLFHKDNIEKARLFYEKHGKISIVLARFMPIVRTFAPIIAGIGDMHYTTFLSFNIIGGLLWGVGVTVAGFFLGKSIPNADKYLLPIILVIVVVSVAPSAWHILKDKKNRDSLKKAVKKLFTRKK